MTDKKQRRNSKPYAVAFKTKKGDMRLKKFWTDEETREFCQKRWHDVMRVFSNRKDVTLIYEVECCPKERRSHELKRR